MHLWITPTFIIRSYQCTYRISFIDVHTGSTLIWEHGGCICVFCRMEVEGELRSRRDVEISLLWQEGSLSVSGGRYGLSSGVPFLCEECNRSPNWFGEAQILTADMMS